MTYYESAAAAPPLARSTRRPTADFDEFVLRYARAQRANIGLIFAGLGLAVGAAMQLHGGLMVALAAIGLGMAGAGAGGFLAAAGAHAAYCRYFSATETAVYADPPAATPTVRPFVASTNPTTIRAGRFSLPAATWAALLAVADANGGKLTRDPVAKAKVLPRTLYREWSTTAGELQRLGIIDAEGMVTANGRGMMSGNPPRPTGDYAAAGAYSTHARRTHDAHGAVWGES